MHKLSVKEIRKLRKGKKVYAELYIPDFDIQKTIAEVMNNNNQSIKILFYNGRTLCSTFFYKEMKSNYHLKLYKKINKYEFINV